MQNELKPHPLGTDIPEQMRAFLDHSPAVAWLKDAQGHHVYLSEPYLDMIGIPCDQWFGKTDFDLWPEPVARKFRALDQQVLRTGEAIQYRDDDTTSLPDGHPRVWWITKFPVHDRHGQSYVGGIAVDITEQTQTQEALRLQHELSDRLIESARNIVMVLNNHGCIVRFNPFMEQLAGWKLDEVQGRPFSDVYLRGEPRRELQRRFESATDHRQERGHILPLVTKDEQTVIIEWYNSPLFDVDGSREGILCIGADTTQRRLLDRQIERIAAGEQRQIGQGLHDGIGQELTALCLFCEHMVDQLDELSDSQRVEPGSLKPIQSLASRINEALRTAKGNVQNLSRSMVMDVCGPDNLCYLLANLATSTDAIPGLRCTFQCSDSIGHLDNEAALHIFRIAQEAVNNAVKHSSASQIDVRFESRDDATVLEIIDDGVGFAAVDRPPAHDSRSAHSEAGGIGLHVMRYRADLIDADFSIQAGRGGGTCVRCMLRS